EYGLSQRRRERPLLRYEFVESGAAGGADQRRRGRDVYRSRIADGDGDCLGWQWTARVEFSQASAQGQSTLIGPALDTAVREVVIRKMASQLTGCHRMWSASYHGSPRTSASLPTACLARRVTTLRQSR